MNFKLLLLLFMYLTSAVNAANLLDTNNQASFTLIDTQLNSSSWAAKNATDGASNTRWLSRYGINDLNFKFTDSFGQFCFNEFDLINYGAHNRSIEKFMLLASVDTSLAADNGKNGWIRIANPDVNVTSVNHLLWGQGGVLDSFSKELNSTSWAAKNLNDGSLRTYWLSNKSNNILEYAFDTDWDDLTGNTIDLYSFNLYNYGEHNRSIRYFQVEVSTDNVNWKKLEVPGSEVGEPNFNFNLQHNGGTVDSVSYELNTTSWAANNINDGDDNTRWLSRYSNNDMVFSFDPNDDDVKDEDDHFRLDKFYLKNYGVHNRSIKEFQIEVKTALNASWVKLPVVGSVLNEPDFDFTLDNNGGDIDSLSYQLNTTSWAAKNINDGDVNTRWLSRYSNNNMVFSFDPNDDGLKNASDYFDLDKIYLRNYGSHNRSIKEFQVEVKTAANSNWEALPVPGSSTGEEDFNYALIHNGGELVSSYELNTTSWAAKNIHDGDSNTIWLSRYSNNSLAFSFDVNKDGNKDAGDYFTFDKFQLENYGNHNRSVKDFQVEVSTDSVNWEKIPVPNSVVGESGFNYTLSNNGGKIESVTHEYNSTTWAAKNINDGDASTIWLSNNQNNTIEFSFDPTGDGLSNASDRFNIDDIVLVNYGNHNRSVKTFEVYFLNNGGQWKIIKDPSDNDTTFEALKSSSEQVWSVNKNGVNGLRLVTLSNYGDYYTGISEFKVLGKSITRNTIFTASRDDSVQEWDIDDIADTTNVKLLTISNYGDYYTGVSEFKILGDSITKNTLFTAARDSSDQVWDIIDEPEDVTHVRFVTVSNYGDTYTGAAEFKVLGDSVSRNTVFTALRDSTYQEWDIALADEPIDVTDIRLQTISNYGDTYTGAAEIGFLGNSVTPATIFEAQKITAKQEYVLDTDDRVLGVKKLRMKTIKNWGDYYTGARDFEAVGPIATNNYIFEAEKVTQQQSFSFSPTSGKLFRFHTVDNFGDTYTGAVEIELQSTDLGSCLIPPLAYYAMDETLWNGDADSVIDSSANGYHGQAMTGATTSNTTPAISGLSGTCNYAEFDGTDDHINVKKTPDLDADFTIATWIYAKNTLGKQIIYADDVNKNTGFSIEIGSDEIVVNSRNVTPTSYSTVGSAIVQNQWHHIAVVHDSDAKTIKVYIDGVSQTLSASLYSGNWLADVGEESIAGDATNSASFDGFIDEFRVYDEAFTASQVELVKGLTHLCGNQVGHYAISHSSNGVTCEAESITISAHGNTHALVAPSAGTTITLSTSEAVDGWSLKSGNGSFDGVNKYTFDGVETSVEFWLSKSIPTTSPHININVTDGSSTDPNDGGAEDPVIAFSDSTFRFYADDVNNDINTQTAFKSSAGDQVLTLKAVETNTDTGACETRLDGAQTVELAYECVTPSTCANNNAVIIDSKPIVGNASGNVTDYTDVSLNFVNGVATWDLKYDDAGKIALHVNKVVAESGSDPEVSLTARSNEFVVKPAGLCVYSDDVGSSCTSSDASCSKFKKAGEAFNLKVKAVGWGGSVENNAQLCDNNITDNFSLSNIALSHSLIAPTTGVPGNISTTLFDMSSGEFIDSSLTFSEVGVFTFTVTPPNYLSEAIAPSTSNNIGRIYPDHFSISNESLINRSDSVVGGIFSYMAESFKIGFTLVAENSSDDTTENYEGAFAKLDSGSEIGTGAVDGGAVDLTSRLVSSNSSFSWTKGTGTLTDTLSFTRQATVDGPYENLSIGVTPHDNDGVTLELFNLDTDLDSINEQHSIGSTKIRFGRMNISSAAGSELQDLSIPLTVEYYNGTSFITNTDDSATGFSIANISMGNQYESAQTDGTISVTGTHTSVLTSLVAFSAGDAGLSLSHPCLVAGPSCAAVSGATGYVDLDLTVGVPYLLFDWDNDVATSDTSPTTIKATFGIFTGNSKMTYIRESY